MGLMVFLLVFYSAFRASLGNICLGAARGVPRD